MTNTNKETRPCPECEAGKMTFQTKPEVIEYKGRTTTIESEGWWCNSCDEAVFGPEALKANEAAFVQLKAEVDELLKPEQVATIRKKLDLSQRQASELLGGGARAFQKYESGTVMVSAAMSNLLRLLDNDPKRLEELPTLRKSEPPAVRVRASSHKRPLSA